MVIRAFIAMDLPPDVVKGLQATAERLSLLGARPVGSKNLHITLLFLGDVPERKVQGITDAITKIKAKSFNCAVDGLATFPAKVPRIVSCRITKGVPELEEINSKLAAGMRELGLPLEEGKFNAHLTLGRCTPSTDLVALDELVGEKPGPRFEFTCKEIKLKSSLLSPSGAVHKDLFVRPLDEA